MIENPKSPPSSPTVTDYVAAYMQATNAVWIPWSIVHISVYGQAKRSATQWQATQLPASPPGDMDRGTVGGSSEPLPAWLLGCLSACSATVACLVTHPADVVKTRLQVGKVSSRATFLCKTIADHIPRHVGKWLQKTRLQVGQITVFLYGGMVYIGGANGHGIDAIKTPIQAAAYPVWVCPGVQW